VDYIITAFTKDALLQKIKKMLGSSGIKVWAVCHSKAEIIRNISGLDGGIIITSYKLADGTADMIYENLPEGFSMMVLATVAQAELISNRDIFIQTLPVSTVSLASSVNMLLKNRDKRIATEKKERKAEEKRIIERAKLKLMEEHMMTEDEAHRFIQKKSMDNGVRMIDMAKIILGV